MFYEWLGCAFLIFSLYYVLCCFMLFQFLCVINVRFAIIIKIIKKMNFSLENIPTAQSQLSQTKWHAPTHIQEQKQLTAPSVDTMTSRVCSSVAMATASSKLSDDNNFWIRNSIYNITAHSTCTMSHNSSLAMAHQRCTNIENKQLPTYMQISDVKNPKM